MMQLRNTRMWLALLAFGELSCRAQGTIRFGFEDYPVGSTPPFVQPGDPQSNALVMAGSPYEGVKFLGVHGQIVMSSPTSEPIQAFSAWVLIPPQGPFFSFLNVADARLQEMNGWQFVTETFATPVSGISFLAGTFQGELTLRANFAIDDVQLTTVPEPSCVILVLAGAAVFLAAGRTAPRRDNSPHDKEARLKESDSPTIKYLAAHCGNSRLI